MSDPVRDQLTREQAVRALLDKRAGYTPGWLPTAGGPANALLQIAGRYLERLDHDLDGAARFARVAFLDALGERRIQAQAAEAPVVFLLSSTATRDAAVPAGTLLRAAPDPRAPERPLASFVTLRSFVATRSRLARVYSVSPAEDRYGDHTPHLGGSFRVLEADQPVEHTFYLGCDLFNLPKACDASTDPPPELQVRFDFRRPLGEKSPPLPIAWEFLAEGGWYPLEDLSEGEAGPSGSLFGKEVAALRKVFGPASKKTKLHGHESYWIRARLLAPLLPLGVDGLGRLPVVDRVFASLRTRVTGLRLDAAMFDAMTLDVSRPFFPFGRFPRTHDTVYLACKSAFERPNARITLDIKSEADFLRPRALAAPPAPPLVWEYFDGSNWSALAPVEVKGALTFLRPANWQESKVFGKQNYWLRVRLAAGDYTEPGVAATLSTPAQPPIVNAPVIKSVTISYEQALGPETVPFGVTSNDFIERDRSTELAIDGRTFLPFSCDPSGDVALCFAFDLPLPSGLVSLYVECDDDQGSGEHSRFIWEYGTTDGWRPLSVVDNTSSLSRSGTLEFVGPWDASATEGFGGSLYRIRARLKQGADPTPIQVRGLWHNATLARNERPYPETQLGTSSGNSEQIFNVPAAGVPVLEGEIVEVREWTRGEGAPVLPGDRLEGQRVVTRGGEPSEIWVRWSARDTLLASGPEDRHYSVDRATGSIRFGDGLNGRIPPPGARLVLKHRSGGGPDGNVDAGFINQVTSSTVSGVDRIYNPLPARGGSFSEPLDEAVVRGGHRLAHRDRGVSAVDFEWLARESTPAVARARCLPTTGPGGLGDRGFVTVIVVPHGDEAQPKPAPELRRRVREFLQTRVPAAIANKIRVVEPRYAPLKILATVLPARDANVSRCEGDVRAALDVFLHPMKGGVRREGWEMGEPVYLSQVAVVLGRVASIERTLVLRMQLDGAEQGEVARVPSDAIVCSDRHELSVSFEEIPDGA